MRITLSNHTIVYCKQYIHTPLVGEITQQGMHGLPAFIRLHGLVAAHNPILDTGRIQCIKKAVNPLNG